MIIEKIPETSPLRIIARVFAHLVFWGWNALFLALVLFGIAPLIGPSLIVETLGGFVPPGIALALISVVLVPILATALGAARFRRDPEALFRLFYAVEVPCFLLALGRLFLVRDMTAGVGFVIATAFVGIAAYLVRLLRPEEEDERGAAIASLAGDGVGLAIALYAAALLAFYALPIGVSAVVAFFRFDWLRSFHVLYLVAIALFFTSASLFFFAPPAFIALYAARFARGARAATSVIGRRAAAITAIATAGALSLGFALSVRQPQDATFTKLAAPPADDAARRARIAGREALRDGLTNAYLAGWRYLGSKGGSYDVRALFRRELGFETGGAERAQATFNAIARPFLYDGDLRADHDRAGELYAGFFDRSIQHGEKDRVLSAMAATYSREDREAGLLTAGERKVRVAKQEIRLLTQRGPIAEIEIHEVYENQTTDPQEVVYFFSLPETAAATGLWLGEVDRREDAFSFTISPRGAAQRVYRGEVQRKRDPALLEQVGPRQYRLRAFPIAARERPRGGTRSIAEIKGSGRPMHLWLRYRVIAEDGSFPLPRLSEARNAYRDRRTERLVDGVAAKLGSEVWLPPSIAARGPTTPREERVKIDASTVITMRPEAAPTAPLRGKRVAVVLDRSYSMRAQADRVVASLAWIREKVEPSNDVDLYLASAPSRGEAPRRLDDPRAIDASAVVYYGGQDPGELLEQLDALRGDTRYDGIVVLTDEGGFDLAGPKRSARDLGAPVWMVHLGGALAPGDGDGAVATIQARGGGVTTKVEAAFARLADARDDPRDLGWADGYRWTIDPSGDAPSDPMIAALAAHRWIPIAARSTSLDEVHRVAREIGVASPFSSMIVLVDDAQRRALAEAEARKDRFERDAETGEARLVPPNAPLGGSLTGAPEPEEWILLAVAALGLAWAYRRRARGLATA